MGGEGETHKEARYRADQWEEREKHIRKLGTGLTNGRRGRNI